eukprot:scaffold141523_cov105-Phaeocystis_antarctica.AAC.1
MTIAPCAGPPSRDGRERYPSSASRLAHAAPGGPASGPSVNVSPAVYETRPSLRTLAPLALPAASSSSCQPDVLAASTGSRSAEAWHDSQ